MIESSDALHRTKRWYPQLNRVTGILGLDSLQQKPHCCGLLGLKVREGMLSNLIADSLLSHGLIIPNLQAFGIVNSLAA